MRVINFIDSIEYINTGIWGSALSTSHDMLPGNIISECWYFTGNINEVHGMGNAIRFLKIPLVPQSITEMARSQGLDKDNCIIVSHGCWRGPTRLAYRFASAGFKWVYVPHGMLEPWAMHQKYLKKRIYFHLAEMRMVRKAALIRAVSRPEMLHLRGLFPGQDVIQLPNGTKNTLVHPNGHHEVGFLFMSRLHEKKGVVPLVEGWIRSGLSRDPDCHLYIAGPDHGELPKIIKIIRSSGVANITYCGVLDDAGKMEHFAKSDFFVLPSYSEGFPTSVIEAMSAGLSPVISQGCNFPEAFEAGLAWEIEPEADAIARSLEKVLSVWKAGGTHKERISAWTKTNYSIERIAHRQADIYKALL
jgi:glycosyltransferase involved in cell wall biosynthesis